MIDTAAGMHRILTAPTFDRHDLIRHLWEPLTGMYAFVPNDVDLAAVHQQSLGFPADRSPEEVRDGLEKLIAADAWARIATALEDGSRALESAHPGIDLPNLTVLLILGDPTGTHFIDEMQGLSGFGGIRGYIVLTVWPTDRVLARLEAIAVHELHHNVRYSPHGIVWNPAIVTVAEHVVAEGLADVFASDLYGACGYTHFGTEDVRADDHVLAKVASGLGNRHSGLRRVGSRRRHRATIRGRPRRPADRVGYAAGVRIVRAYLEATGSSAASDRPRHRRRDDKNTVTDWTVHELAKRAGISRRTLRHYDHIGLLKLERIGSNGYRYYGHGADARRHTPRLVRRNPRHPHALR